MFASRTRSSVLSVVIHGGILALLLASAGGRLPQAPVPHPSMHVARVIAPYIPLPGGGGGGERSETAASLGQLPRIAPRQFTPPLAVVRNESPRLVMEPTLVGHIDLALPDAGIARLGLPDGVAGPPSGGRGSGGGMGDGVGGGAGNSTGPGFGPNPGGGVAAQPPGGGKLTPAVVLWKIEPEYTDEARRAKVQGTVILYIEIDGVGQPCNLHVQQGLGLGLDERAIDAVRRWKFRPGTRNGAPIATTARVEVNFRLL